MRLFFYLMLGVVMITACVPAAAQSCFPRDELVQGLGEGFQEVPRMRALTSTGQLVEMFAAPSGTWTMFLTTSGGMPCPIAAGKAFDFIDAPEGDPA